MGKWDFLHSYDAQVHSALATGNVKQAFEVLLQGYQGVVVRYCTTLLADAADGEDVAQEVFVAVLRALPRYQPTALLRTWIFRIARNLCRKHQAKRWFWRQRQEEHRTGNRDTTGAEIFPSPEDQHQARVDDKAFSISRGGKWPASALHARSVNATPGACCGAKLISAASPS